MGVELDPNRRCFNIPAADCDALFAVPQRRERASHRGGAADDGRADPDEHAGPDPRADLRETADRCGDSLWHGLWLGRHLRVAAADAYARARHTRLRHPLAWGRVPLARMGHAAAGRDPVARERGGRVRADSGRRVRMEEPLT